MSTDERAIVDYLKSWPSLFVSGREIARKVGGKKRFEEDRGWAIPILSQLILVGVIEPDFYGGFRLKKRDKKRGPRTHVSPQMMAILEKSGKNFEGIVIDEDGEDSSAISPDATVSSTQNGKPAV
jgi:hypothetical protein